MHSSILPIAVAAAHEKLPELTAQIHASDNTLPLEVRHHFAGRVYARELPIPAGTILVGRIHLSE